MALAERTLLWTTRTPATWPGAPGEMTVTTLAEIEACPRRWALGAAEYPAVWSGRGYPPRYQPSALAGTVVHLTLETITRELVRAACSSVQDSKASQVMRDLGGYTKIVHGCIDRVLDRLAHNPRAAPLLEDAARTLRAQVSESRMRVQTILCRVGLPVPPAAAAEGSGPRRRGPLGLGAYPEIELRAQRIGWKGRADLLFLSDNGCEISDFKTGAQEDGHRFQIQVYALLWRADEELNPTRRRADRLVLRYGGVDVEVPAPTASQLDDLERDLVARRNAALRAVSERPPEARPTVKNCHFCGVRQLCAEYWDAVVQWNLAANRADHLFTDAELTVTARHGPSSWDAIIELSPNAAAGRPAVLRTKGHHEFQPGDRLRVLDAAVTLDAEDHEQPVVITLGALSEAYAVA